MQIVKQHIKLLYSISQYALLNVILTIIIEHLTRLSMWSSPRTNILNEGDINEHKKTHALISYL